MKIKTNLEEKFYSYNERQKAIKAASKNKTRKIVIYKHQNCGMSEIQLQKQEEI